MSESQYGDIELDGLNVLAVAQFDGNIWAGEAQLTLGLYIDARADARQRDALQQVFSGHAGGFMATFAQLIGAVRGLEFVPITFAVADDLAHWRAESLAKWSRLPRPCLVPQRRLGRASNS